MYKKNIFFRWIIVLTQPVRLPRVEFSPRFIIRVKINSNVRIGARIFVIPSSPDAIFLVVTRRDTILDGFLDRAVRFPVDTENSEEQCGEQEHLRGHEHLATEEFRRNRGDTRTDRVHGDSSSVVVFVHQLPPFSPIDARYTIRGLIDDWEGRWTSSKLCIIMIMNEGTINGDKVLKTKLFALMIWHDILIRRRIIDKYYIDCPLLNGFCKLFLLCDVTSFELILISILIVYTMFHLSQ